jgi:hypothetical protein
VNLFTPSPQRERHAVAREDFIMSHSLVHHAIAVILLAWSATPAIADAPPIRTDANLATAQDVSDSIMRHEEWLEFEGLAKAVTSAALLDAIASGRQDGSALECVHAEAPIDQHGGRLRSARAGRAGRVQGAAGPVARRACACMPWFGRGLAGVDQREIDDVVARRPEPAVDPPLLRNRMEQAFVSGDAFRGTEKQVPVLAQGKMEQREHLLLDIRFQVDQQAAAADQIEPGKRRILQEILWRKGDRFAHRFPDLIAVVLDLEKPLEPVPADVVCDAGGIQTCARRGQEVMGDVGGEDPEMNDFPASCARTAISMASE